MKIIPSVLTDNKDIFAAEIDKYRAIFDEIQIDIADGIFVQNKTLGMDAVNTMTADLKISLHLMVNDPRVYIAQIKNKNVSSCICHVEVSADFSAVKNELGKTGILFGLAVNPETETGSYQSALEASDFIQLMGVNPGFQGQQFMPIVLKKYDLIKNLGKPLWIDGGINNRTIDMIREYDFKTIVVGSYFQSGDVSYKLKYLKERLWTKE